MLILTRKVGSRVFIGDNITITIVEIDRGKVRLGISAPEDVPVWRDDHKHPWKGPTSAPLDLNDPRR